MSRRPTYRYVALIMAFVLFSTSVGISMDFHYCQGDLKSIALFSKAKSCHEIAAAANQVPSCHKHKTASSDAPAKHEDDCCNNETRVLQMDTDFTDVPSSNLKLNLEVLVKVFVVGFDLMDIREDQVYTDYQHYKPPLPNQELYILIEQYLI